MNRRNFLATLTAAPLALVPRWEWPRAAKPPQPAPPPKPAGVRCACGRRTDRSATAFTDVHTSDSCKRLRASGNGLWWEVLA